jgi:hypothetical protein
MDAEHLKPILEEHYPYADDGISTHMLAACASTGLPLSYMLALVEKETAFQNLFGSDAVRNTVKGGRVTQARYTEYKRQRKAGLGMQGVGYTQLTWYALQDSADRLGGCWKPYPNLVVGAGNLKRLCNLYGKEKGAAAYNGTGPAAEAYGRDFVRKQEAWHRRVA